MRCGVVHRLDGYDRRVEEQGQWQCCVKLFTSRYEREEAKSCSLVRNTRLSFLE